MRRLMLKVFMTIAGFFKTFSAGFLAVAWGISRREELVHLIRNYWDSNRSEKEEGYVLGGLSRWEEALCETHLLPGGKVGLIGCGGGRDIIGLVRKGYHVEGVDLSPEMIRVAQGYLARAGVEARLYCGDICDFEFPDGLYDAFIFSNLTYSFIPGSSRRVELLRRIRSRLSSEGCIILTYSFRKEERQDNRLTRTARWVAKMTRNPKPPEEGDHLSMHGSFYHPFTHEEIAGEIKSAGHETHEVRPYPEGSEFAITLKPAFPDPHGAGQSKSFVGSERR